MPIQIESKTSDDNIFHSSWYSPVYLSEEPYEGFFNEKRFPEPEYTQVASIGSHRLVKALYVFTEKYKSLAQKLCVPLPAFPVISSRQTLYVHNNSCELYSKGSSLAPNNDPDKRIKFIDLFELNERVKAGEDPKSVMLPLFDALAKNNCAFWHGYVIETNTSENRQTIVFDEDFGNAENVVDAFNIYAKQNLEQIYNDVNEEKVNKFVKSLEKSYEDLNRIIMNSFQQSRFLEKQIIYQEDMDEEILKAQAEQIRKEIDKPYDTWMKTYELDFEESGLLKAEKKIESFVVEYGQRKNLKIHVPKVEGSYRKHLMIKNLEEILR